MLIAAARRIRRPRAENRIPQAGEGGLPGVAPARMVAVPETGLTSIPGTVINLRPVRVDAIAGLGWDSVTKARGKGAAPDVPGRRHCSDPAPKRQ